MLCTALITFLCSCLSLPLYTAQPQPRRPSIPATPPTPTVSAQQQKSDKAALDKQLQDLLKTYHPTPDCNKGYFEESVEKDQEAENISDDDEDKIALNNLEEELACMLAGYKDVYYDWGNDLSANITLITKKFDALLKAHNIHCIISKVVHPALQTEQFSSAEYTITECILYTPRGKTNALLLLKYLLEHQEWTDKNHYIIGILIGYPEDSIHSYYRQQRATGVIDRDFNHDKKESPAWIKEHTPTIEQWIRDNTKRYNIIDTLGLH